MSTFDCKTCLEKFKWSDILHNFLSIGKIPLVCKKCRQEYYITFTSKLIFAVLVAIPLFGAKFFLRNSLGELGFLFYIIASIILFLISPFFLKYTPKK